MNKFVAMADEAIKNHKNENIDDYLGKIASQNNLNTDEHQRLVEEYNVGAFLNKLQEGTHHEEYDIASPVRTEQGSASNQSSNNLEKAASEELKYVVTEDMFNVSLEETHTEKLEKVASVVLNDELFASEEKWEAADIARQSIFKDKENMMEKIAAEDKISEMVQELLKTASTSEGMTKTAILSVHRLGFESEAETMLENSKFSTADIKDAVAESLTEKGTGILSSLVDANA